MGVHPGGGGCEIASFITGDFWPIFLGMGDFLGGVV